jgi:hypothetical protein
MQQLILNISDSSKLNTLVDFLKTLNYVSIQNPDEGLTVLSSSQQSELDSRRASSNENDYLSWEEVKKQLVFKGK